MIVTLSDESRRKETIHFLSYGHVLVHTETLMLLFDFPSHGVHVEVVLNDRVIDPRHLIMTRGEHILVLDEEPFQG